MSSHNETNDRMMLRKHPAMNRLSNFIEKWSLYNFFSQWRTSERRKTYETLRISNQLEKLWSQLNAILWNNFSSLKRKEKLEKGFSCQKQ